MNKPWLKFVVVLCKRDDLSETQFRSYLREIHGPMGRGLPGVKKYVQNYPADDPKRRAPSWNAIVELYWDDWESMERAWSSPAGQRATADLAAFADLSRTSWSVVHEFTHDLTATAYSNQRAPSKSADEVLD
jgi:uncharacterized protein (TIGR02118 family)